MRETPLSVRQAISKGVKRHWESRYGNDRKFSEEHKTKIAIAIALKWEALNPEQRRARLKNAHEASRRKAAERRTKRLVEDALDSERTAPVPGA